MNNRNDEAMNESADSRPILGPWFTRLAFLLVLAQLAFWIPHYLTWPYHNDHDVFAYAAQAWDSGLLPYRDVRLNQTPGTVYEFWILGKLVGWAQPSWFYGLDATLTGTLAIGFLVWSRVRFGRIAPGLVAALAILAVLLNLNYTHTAQRDGQTPVLCVLVLLILQAAPRSLVGLVLSAALAAFAIAIRPQAILFVPAWIWSAGWVSLDNEGNSTRLAPLGRAVIWSILGLGFGLLLLLPLIAAGLMHDFVTSLRLVAPGSSYSQQAGFSKILSAWFAQASELRYWAVIGVFALLWRNHSRSEKRLAVAWILALAGVSLYKPLSPVPHYYLSFPLPITAAGALAVAVSWVDDLRLDARATRRIALIGLIVLMIPEIRAEYVKVGATIRVVATWLRIKGPSDDRPPAPYPDRIPPGTQGGNSTVIPPYPWKDYAALINYLRKETAPTTRVANLLKSSAAVVGMVGRLSALPAEGVAWLQNVRPEDEPAFARHLENEKDSVVVWIPNEGHRPYEAGNEFDELSAVTRRLYQPAARFGLLEVWRRIEPVAHPNSPSPP